MPRVVVDADGRYVSLAYRRTVLTNGQRFVNVTQPELERLLAGDYAWLNNKAAVLNLAQLRASMTTNRQFLALDPATIDNTIAVQQLRRLTRQVQRTLIIAAAPYFPELLDDISDI